MSTDTAPTVPATGDILDKLLTAIDDRGTIDVDDLRRGLEQARAAGRAEEREACARLAEEKHAHACLPSCEHYGHVSFAGVIRAR